MRPQVPKQMNTPAGNKWTPQLADFQLAKHMIKNKPSNPNNPFGRTLKKPLKSVSNSKDAKKTAPTSFLNAC